MHESTRTLVEDLKKLPKSDALDALIREAENDVFNDYFGIYDNPQLALIEKIRRITSIPHYDREVIVSAALDGKYDGTKEESEEWMRSPEGRETFSFLMNKGKKKN